MIKNSVAIEIEKNNFVQLAECNKDSAELQNSLKNRLIISKKTQ